jgi:HAE1 family hydrophobic/amphiphilic exporter-1
VFATIRHREGRTPLHAAIEGAKIRLRPILMTSFAFIAGLLPLLLQQELEPLETAPLARRVGWYVIRNCVRRIIIPGLYVIFASIAEKFVKKGKTEELALTEVI